MLKGTWSGNDLTARLFRGSSIVALGFATSQAIRLGSNLILTRLLFPEAFGLMALITVFLVGLTMLSDIGVSPSIQRSERGDDPDFLNTAWTLKVGRGVILFIACALLGSFAAWIYADDRLAVMLPVAGLSLLIAGFNPTRMDTASRHLLLGRVTLLDLASQTLSIVIMIVSAYYWQSVWALVIGGVIGALIKLIVMDLFLPGPRNRFHWDAAAAREVITFGKWIFLSTLCGFVLAQGDKAIFGAYLTLEMLGIYNIGFFMGAFAVAMVGRTLSHVMIPLHRDKPPGASPENYSVIRKARFAITFIVFSFQFLLAFGGVLLIDFLYDERFALAGAIVVAVACMNVPHIIGMSYGYSALGQGDSRGFFSVLVTKALFQTVLLTLGMELSGLSGALFGIWISHIAVHPLIIRLGRKHGAWDPWHDIFYGALGLILTGCAVWFHWEALSTLHALDTVSYWGG